MESHFIETACRIADQSREVIERAFRRPFDVNLKPDASPVTAVDLAVENLIRSELNAAFPSHSLQGEEYEPFQGTSEYTWIIDPIDGTKAFACGKPLFATLIALLRNEIPILGIIDQPITNERWIGIVDRPTQLNDQIIHTSRVNSLSSARLSCTTPDMFTTSSTQSTFNKLKKAVQLTSFGGDAYAFGCLAAGYVDLILEAQLKFHDVAALIPIIQGAGGEISDWQGNSITPSFNGECLCAANERLHKLALAVIA